MARRPDPQEVEMLSKENPSELRHNLAHLSLPAVGSFTKEPTKTAVSSTIACRAHGRCKRLADLETAMEMALIRLNGATMPKRQQRGGKAKSQSSGTLKGWQQIAAFLGEPTSVVPRWASEGMPLHRHGHSSRPHTDEHDARFGKESGKLTCELS